MFIPSRHLKSSVARFMANYPTNVEGKGWQHLFLPNHVAFQKGKTRAAQLGKTHGRTEYLNENRFEEEANDSDDSDDDRKGPRIGLPAHRALEMIPHRELRSELLHQPAETEKEFLKRKAVEQHM